MSGTSLDGLDLAYVEFWQRDQNWFYEIGPCKTIPYTSQLIHQLKETVNLSGEDLAKLHLEFGKWMGEIAAEFLSSHKLQPHLIASHGHTIFHQPEVGFTFQLGHGAGIRAITGIQTISDFRSLDVLLGGQGAPLVPVGDRLLFHNYQACLNLGGISNISFEHQDQLIAFDISPCNIVLNHVVQEIGLSIDEDGKLARSGQLHSELLSKLNELPYYHQPPPKSLGREWVEKHFLPVVMQYHASIPDLLHTLCIHIATQITQIIHQFNLNHTLITGGGAHHSFLLDTISTMSKHKIEKGASVLIDYKEALIFAFLGLLKTQGIDNTLASVTGAKINSSGGMIC